MKVKIIVSVVSLFLLWSCNNDSVEDSTIKDFDKIGKKLENPYKVSTMKQAFKNLQLKQRTLRTASVGSVVGEQNLDDTNFEIETSHVYVKFSPKSADEEAKLKQDSTMILSNYPLDYEFTDQALNQIKTQATKLKSTNTSSAEKETFPDYYIAIPVEKKITQGVPVQELEELYIPEKDPYFADVEGVDQEELKTASTNKNATTASKKALLLEQLLHEAFKITNNLKEPEKPNANGLQTNWWIFGKKWRPAGRIMRWDNVLNKQVPVTGAQVLMRQWFTVDSGITDGNGYFSTGTVRGEARYVIQWERYHYSIRDGDVWQAETHGPMVKRQDWNPVLWGGKDAYHATIHQAAHDYYYGYIKGLNRPPLKGNTGLPWYNAFLPQMKIAAKDKVNDDEFGRHTAYTFYTRLWPTIKIWNPQRSSAEIYATTIHELAHAAHWNMIYRLFNFGEFLKIEDKVIESWASGVQWELTRLYYPNYFGRFWNPTKSPEYTLVVTDMIDDIDSNNKNNGFSDTRDEVSSYTIKQIEDALVGVKTWTDWKNNIKNKYDNATENNLDKLFKAYE